jgi:hypothetical protein
MNNLRLNPTQVEKIALQSSGPFEALQRIDPALVTRAFEDRQSFLTPEFLPYIVGYRDLPEKTQVELVYKFMDRYQVDSEANIQRGSQQVERYGIDADVRKTEIVEGGLKERVRIDSNTRIDAQSRIQQVANHGIDVDFRKTEVVEGGLTKRAKIEMQGFVSLQKLKCETAEKISSDYEEGQRYLSDNQVKIAEIEADAYLDGISVIETIEAATARGISRDSLEKEIKLKVIEFGQKINEGEILRDSGRDRNRAEVIGGYLRSQVDMYIATLETQARIGIAERKAREKATKQETKRYREKQKTIRRGIESLMETVSDGNEQAKLEVRTNNETISIEYQSKPNEDP